MISQLLAWLRSLFGKNTPVPPKPTPVHQPQKIQLKTTPKPTPPMPKLLYEGTKQEYSADIIKESRTILHYEKNGRKIGPTSSQENVIFFDGIATLVGAGAGSGKSTTLVSRILFLHKFCEQPLHSISVFTFTRKSRADFIKKLVQEAKRWDINLDDKQAHNIVRTFHSKVLEAARATLDPRTRIFEFIGENSGSSKSTTEVVELANEIASPFSLDSNQSQVEILKSAYAEIYAADKKFQSAVRDLFDYSIRTQTDDDIRKAEKS